MSKKARNIILLVVGLQLIVVVGLLALPAVAQAIPGRYRVALQERVPAASQVVEGVIDQVAPVATALPAAANSTTGDEVDIAALLAAAPTAAATAVPRPTLGPTVETAVTVPADAPTPLPTEPPPPTPTPTPKPLPAVHVVVPAPALYCL